MQYLLPPLAGHANCLIEEISKAISTHFYCSSPFVFCGQWHPPSRSLFGNPFMKQNSWINDSAKPAPLPFRPWLEQFLGLGTFKPDTSRCTRCTQSIGRLGAVRIPLPHDLGGKIVRKRRNQVGHFFLPTSTINFSSQ